jgi:hypothetical protein
VRDEDTSVNDIRPSARACTGVIGVGKVGKVGRELVVAGHAGETPGWDRLLCDTTRHVHLVVRFNK